MQLKCKSSPNDQMYYGIKAPDQTKIIESTESSRRITQCLIQNWTRNLKKKVLLLS